MGFTMHNRKNEIDIHSSTRVLNLRGPDIIYTFKTSASF